MNYALPTLLMLSLSMNACAQKVSEADVPQPVKAAFMKQFPKAEHAKWEMEDKKDYEVNFQQGATKWSAKYAADAKWLETEHAIKPEELPAPVRAAIAANYADHKLEAAEVAESPQGIVYEVDLEKGEHSMEVVFAADGKVVKSLVTEEVKRMKGRTRRTDRSVKRAGAQAPARANSIHRFPCVALAEMLAQAAEVGDHEHGEEEREHQFAHR
ncbi:MAG: PepSY-like domain-containing protein [Flavobacteriales bacterium]|nr:MAG: PepSY-like domain-containing protein [Flavobacteriales bacterium]